MEKLQYFKAVTNNLRVYTNFQAFNVEEAVNAVKLFTRKDEYVTGILCDPENKYILTTPTIDAIAYEKQNNFNNELLKALKDKTAQYKGVSKELGDLGLLEIKIEENYSCIYFDYGFDYVNNNGDIVPEFYITVKEVYDLEGSEVDVINCELILKLEEIIKDILDNEDVETWESFGVDEERLYFEDDTPDYPITL